MEMDISKWMHECPQCLACFAEKGDLLRHTLYHLQAETLQNHAYGGYRYPHFGQHHRNIVNNNQKVSTHNAKYQLTSQVQQPHINCSRDSNTTSHTIADSNSHNGTHENARLRNEHVFPTGHENIIYPTGNNYQWPNLPPYQCPIPTTPLMIPPMTKVPDGFKPQHPSGLHPLKEVTSNSTLGKPNELDKAESWPRSLECGLQFRNNADHAIHTVTHISQKPEYCPICNGMFKDQLCLIQHMKTDHEDKDDHVCSYCGKVFTEQSQLNKHFQMHMKPVSDTFNETKCKFTDASAKELQVVTRVRKKKNKCYICYKMFRTKSDVSRHLMIHTGERPFRCSFCPCGFIVLQSLKVHTVGRHKNLKPQSDEQDGTMISEKPSLVEKPTALQETSNLKTGHSTHRRLRCCNTTFSTVLEIQRHWLVHNEEKTFKCPHCEMAFTKGYTRTKHIMHQHAGVKPNCLDCGQEFTQFQDLIKHMKLHEEQITNHGFTYKEVLNTPTDQVNDDEPEEPHLINLHEEQITNQGFTYKEDLNMPTDRVDDSEAEELHLNALMLLEMDIADTRDDPRPLSPREEEILDALM